MRMHWIACLFVLLAAPASAVQKQVRKEDKQGGVKPNLITIGDSRISQGTFSGPDEKPFLAALAALKSTNGGQIEVLPGRYLFKNTVLVQRPGVTIRGSRASVIDGRGIKGGQPALRITGPGCMLDGVHLLGANQGKGGALLEVSGEDFSLVNCRFDAMSPQKSAGGKAPGQGTYRLVHTFPGSKDAGATRQGTLLQGNSFVFGMSSNGVVGVESLGARSLRINSNEFIGAEGSEDMASVGGALLLRDGEWVTVSGNTFLRMSAPSGVEDDTNAILASINSAAEGHHISITGNFFEVLEGRAIVNLAGGTYNVITGNVFGRTLSPQGVLRLKAPGPASGGGVGSGNVISSNQFHHHSGGFALSNPAIVVQDQEQVSITANQFTDCAGPQVIIGSPTSLAYGAFVTDNQFHARPCNGNQPISSAIQFNSGGSHFVGSNIVLDGGIQQDGCGWANVVSVSGSADVKVGAGNEILP